MKFYQVALVCLLFGLAGCGNKSNSNSSSPNPPPNGKLEDASTDYTQTADLNLAQTNQELKGVRSNAVSLKGTGTKSTYKAIYKFNSGTNSSFRVIETSLHSSYSNCSAPQTKMYLKGKNLSRELTVLDQVNVDLNSDYTLEIVANHSCKELDLTFDVVAWTGFPTVDPKIASVCDGQQTLQATFVMNVNLVTAFSSIVGKEKFLSMDAYCGESFRGSKTECSGSANLFLPDKGPAMSHAQCTAEKENGESRSFVVDFDTPAKTASVVCKSGTTETHSEVFRNCRSLIVDYKPYSQLLLNSAQ